jgi:hypothetical protein
MIQNAITKHVRLMTPSPYMKRWWTMELAKKKKKMKQAGGRVKYHQQNRQHPIHEEYRQHNRYSKMIRKTKAEYWIEWLEGLNKSSIWQASRLVTAPATDAGKARIPTLQIKNLTTKQITREATDNDSKGQLLYKTFFPPPNPATMAIPQDQQYPPPQWTFTNITDEQIHHAIGKMKLYKATRNGTVPNSGPHTHKGRASPTPRSTISSHKQTELLPTGMGAHGDSHTEKTRKARLHGPNSVAAHSAIRWNGSTTQQLPDGGYCHHVQETQHTPSQPLRSKTRPHYDQLHTYAHKNRKRRMAKRSSTSTLFLDVKGAFPSVDINRLIHNMRKRGIPKKYTKWIRRRLENYMHNPTI